MKQSVRRDKKIIITLLAIILAVFISGCSNQTDKATVQDSNSQETATAEYNHDELLSEVAENYDLDEVISAFNVSNGEVLESQGIPDMFLIIEELISQGHAEEVDFLRTIPDKIGYYPSAIFGNYIADENHVIHDTNGPCFEVIPSSKIITIGPFSSIDQVVEEINDGDQHLDGYSICEECLGN